MGAGSRDANDLVLFWRELHQRLGGADPSNRLWKSAAFGSVRGEHGTELPPSYTAFMDECGPGTLAGFLHFQPPRYLTTYRERLSPFMDDELQAAIRDSGDILVFADSDNGDACGWHLAELRRHAEPRVMHLRPRSFDAVPLADDFAEFFQQIADGTDVFGTGKLSLRYVPMAPFGGDENSRRSPSSS